MAGDSGRTVLARAPGEPSIVVTLLACCLLTSSPAPAADAPALLEAVSDTVPGLGADALDASAFFQRLVDRYRELEAYEDTADVVYVTERPGKEPIRVESRLTVEIDDDTLRVETPGSQVRDALGLTLPATVSPAIEAIKLRYKLWLAPHMALRFTDDPLREFRHGIDEGFTPTVAESVLEGRRKLIHLRLQSGDGLSEEYAARFDLYINPATMLIERIEGEQRVADGLFRTTMEITPVRAEGRAEPAIG